MMDGSVFPNDCLYGYEESTIETSIYLFSAKSLMIRLCDTPQQSLGLRRVAFLSQILKNDELTHVFPA